MTRKFTLFMALACMLGFVSARAAVSGNFYDKEAASVVWAFNDANYATTVTPAPAEAFSYATFDPGVCTYKEVRSTTVCPDIKFVGFSSKNGGSDVVKWCIKPAKGLTFTPTSISFYVSRGATDGKGNDVTVKGEVNGGSSVSFSTITPHRCNKSKADDNRGNLASYTTKYEYTLTAEQQSQLTSGEGFNLVLNNGYDAGKGCYYSDVQIHGTLSGTMVAVPKYTLSAKSNLENACVLTVNPKTDSYDAGSEVSLSAEKNFGYKFINWTDASGKEVSKEPAFTYTVDANAELTANFSTVKTYELAYEVTGGANDYMVSLSPAPTVVDAKNMYEEGTLVTVTAEGNDILSFTGWGDGQTSSQIALRMDADHTDLVANYDAADFIAVWDFIRRGSDSRPADFFAAGNDNAVLMLRNAAGESTGWLDKSRDADGGYEGAPAAVNWRTTGLGDYYWQTMVNAEAFTDIKLKTSMLLNYNAYSKQNVEYSLDGETWKNLGTITISGTKKWTEGNFSLPAEANNQPVLYIRWISDKTSETLGSTSANDGIALGAIYITGTAKLVDDGKAPQLVSFIPVDGADNVSINGKISLTFDEKVKVKEGAVATLGNFKLTPKVTGKTVMFEYKNLVYTTNYTFTLPAGSIMDLTDNANDKEIVINFSTKTRPVVTKALYDAEVSNITELIAAIDAAEKRDDTSKRFRIFIHNGTYKFPASDTAVKNGSSELNDENSTYPDPTTYINTPNISFIGESRDGVIITNDPVDKFIDGKHVLEGIGKGDVLDLNKNATGTYFQHLTMKSGLGDNHGRDIVLNDKSDKTICKDVCLWGFQDTYVSNRESSRFYFEGGVLRGRTDFLCGKGDVYYNGVTLRIMNGGTLTAPSVCRQFGYVFKDCEIIGDTDGVDGKFTLGRPWGKGTPGCLYIDTKMTVKPSAAGWNEMSGGWPMRFAEYNSFTAAGTTIDISGRKKSFGDKDKDGIFSNNPILTKEEADYHSYARVMGGDDDWDPAMSAEQAPAPTNVVIDGNTLTWDNSDYASLWAVCKNGSVIGFTTEPTYTIDATAERAAAVYSVRAANEMGGLGEAVEAGDKSSILDVYADAEVVSSVYYNMQGIRVNATTPGVLVKVDTLASGETVVTKIIVK